MSDKLREAFKKDHPETIGETDRAFDNYNYIEWLEKQLTEPKHETVEQWKVRTGEPYHHDYPVKLYYIDESWEYMRYRKAINLDTPDDCIFVASPYHYGKPKEE